MAEKSSQNERLQQIRASLEISEATLAHVQLRRVREGYGWTREKLAEILTTDVNKPVDPNTIRRWEKQERTPGLQFRRKLSRLLGIPLYAWEESDEQIKEGLSQPSVPSLQEAFPQEKLLPSLWHLPYARNPYFIDQRNLIRFLRQRLTAEEIGATRQAISGLGGIGKTQLALAYAYQYRDAYTAVFWVGASTQTQMFKDFVHIGKRLQVPEAQKARPQQRYIVNEVIHWLCTRSGWLLILDNVEEGLDEDVKEAIAEEKTLTIEALLRIPDKGHIVLTTRSQALAHQVQNILLEEMRPEEGAQLLLLRDGQPPSPHLARTASDAHREEVLALARLLEGLPLALEQARAYIEATGCGFTGYRHLYETSRKELLQSVAKGSRLEKEYKESVATTWLISFRHVEQQFAAASDVLKLYAYVAPDAIPEELLLKGAEKLDGSLHQLAENRFQFNLACEVLLNYSLIKRDADEALLSIHRLIQAVLQDHFDDDTQRYWAEQAMRAVEHAFYVAADTEVERYIPHAQMCAQFIERYRLEGEEAAFLLKMVAKAIDERGWYAQAQHLYSQAFQAYGRQFGADDTRTLNLLFDVLHIHSDMGMSLFAADAYRRIIADFKRVLGPDHPNLLVLLNNITWIHFASGEYESAVQTGMEALQLLQRAPDVDIVERAKTYQVAAEILVLSGNADRADVYYQEAKTIFEQRLGSEHQEVANTLMNWGALYALRGNLEQAERLVQQAVEIRQRTCGRDHPETADGLVALAAIVWQKGRYSEAEEYYQQVLTIRQQKLGQYNPGVLQTLRSLAQLAAVQKKDEEAEHYFHDALALAPSTGGIASDEYKLLLKSYVEFLRDRGRIEEVAKYDE